MIAIIEKVYQFLWGDWIVLPLPGGSSFRFSLLVLILIPAGIWFTIRTRFLPIRLFPDMLHTLFEKKGKAEGESHNSTLSALQTLIVSTATRVGMGNLVGVVAAISAGGAGAVFWMWVTALIGSSTAFVEATLAQIYKEKDPVYGGYRGGPAYYMHRFIQEKRGGKKKRYVGISVLFAMSGLICWCGISQVISNSVTSAFHNAFHSANLYHSGSGGTCSSDHFSKNCNGKSAGCAGTDYGRMLFSDYCDFDLYEFFCPSGGVFQNL